MPGMNEFSHPRREWPRLNWPDVQRHRQFLGRGFGVSLAGGLSMTRSFDPRRLDVAAFAQAAQRLAGEWPLGEFGRLLQDALPLGSDSPAASVAWSARGELRAVAGGGAQIWLHLAASTTLRLACQRCLQPMTVALEIRPKLRFVHGEEQAERLDEEGEDDVLALDKALDLHDLIEDELILALPLVPRHDPCPRPLPMSTGVIDAPAGGHGEHPFAALHVLRPADGHGEEEQ
jgi:uncharacterized protein